MIGCGSGYIYFFLFIALDSKHYFRGRRGRDRMVVGFSAYHHYGCEFEPCLWRGVLDAT